MMRTAKAGLAAVAATILAGSLGAAAGVASADTHPAKPAAAQQQPAWHVVSCTRYGLPKGSCHSWKLADGSQVVVDEHGRTAVFSTWTRGPNGCAHCTSGVKR